ncbi:hypothetical protein BKA62DRAFT_620799 [Auriculariales sp. MPI-PUGE-AT-0066]|nr:hypothetical protein BKA62DRAFT_620799 [Auriculariales sp. MPI-PUGE-AT-0066]
MLSPPQISLFETHLSHFEEEEPPEYDDDLGIRQRFLRWIKAPGHASDDSQAAVLGAGQMLIGLLLFKILRVQPIIPLLLTPLLAATTVPVPAAIALVSQSRPYPLKMLASIGCLAVLHEALRATVAAATHMSLQRRKEQAGAVLLRGAALPPPIEEDGDEEDDFDQECIICSAPGRSGLHRTPSSESLASLASSTAGGSAALGPLEIFCSTAPKKHLAHRQCFLAWRAAHVQTYGTPAVLTLLPSSIPSQANSSTRTIVIDHGDDVSDFELDTARELLRAGPAEVSTLFYSVAPMSQSHFRPPLPSPSGPWSEQPTMRLISAPGAPLCGEITSQSPPCPLCRAATTVVLETVPPHPSEMKPITPRRLWRAFCKQWMRLVSGKTIGARVLGQSAFLWALLGVMRVREQTWQKMQKAREAALADPGRGRPTALPRQGSITSQLLAME